MQESAYKKLNNGYERLGKLKLNNKNIKQNIKMTDNNK